MKIKELKEDYPLVYAEALKQQVKCGNKRNDNLEVDDDEGKGNFSFPDTTQGFRFWRNIGDGNFDKAKELCPELFEDKQKIYKDDEGRNLKDFKVGEWYKNPMLSKNRSGKGLKYFRISSVTREESFKSNYYHNLNFDKAITDEGRLIEYSDSQANTDFEAKMELVNFDDIYQEPHKAQDKVFYHYVYCSDKIKWDYVADKLGRKADASYLKYGDCINIDKPNSSKFKSDLINDDTVKILTFKEWCEEYGYSLKSVDKEVDLLAEAKRRYPIGTQYIPAHIQEGINEVVTETHQLTQDTIHVESKNIENGYNGCIYYFGTWAEIVSKPSIDKEEYNPKVGDCVITEGYSENYDGRVLKIEKFGGYGSIYFSVLDGGYYNEGNNFHVEHILRRANKIEILQSEQVLLEKLSGGPVTRVVKKADTLPKTAEELVELYTNTIPHFTKDELIRHLSSHIPFSEYEDLKGRLTKDKAERLMDLSPKPLDKDLSTRSSEGYEEISSDAWEKLGKAMEFKYDYIDWPSFGKTNNSDEFMEPIKVQPYKKKKSKIKLIFNN